MKVWISGSGLLSIVLLSSPAWSADRVIPPPQGLSVCAPESQILVAMKRIASGFGTLAGCFVSTEQAPVNGIDKPVESALAITLFQRASGPFTVASVDQLYATTEQQWKNVAPLWSKDKTAYEQHVRRLVQEVLSSASMQSKMSIEQPVLVSMQRIDPGSYMVVSIRRRKLSNDGILFTFDTAEGYALILNDGKLTRLTIQRQLRGQGDVNEVESEIAGWLKSTGEALLAK